LGDYSTGPARPSIAACRNAVFESIESIGPAWDFFAEPGYVEGYTECGSKVLPLFRIFNLPLRARLAPGSFFTRSALPGEDAAHDIL